MRVAERSKTDYRLYNVTSLLKLAHYIACSGSAGQVGLTRVLSRTMVRAERGAALAHTPPNCVADIQFYTMGGAGLAESIRAAFRKGKFHHGVWLRAFMPTERFIGYASV